MKSVLINKLLNKDACELSDVELLALILKKNTINGDRADLKTAIKIINDNNFTVLDFLEYKDLEPISLDAFIKVKCLLEFSRRYHEQKIVQKIKNFRNSEDIANFFSFLIFERYEYFYILVMDSAKRLITYRSILKGDQATLFVNVKDILLTAISFKAHYVALIHNHPDGNSNPSENDKISILNLFNIFSNIQISVLDAIIIAKDGYYSFNHKIKTPFKNLK